MSGKNDRGYSMAVGWRGSCGARSISFCLTCGCEVCLLTPCHVNGLNSGDSVQRFGNMYECIEPTFKEELPGGYIFSVSQRLCCLSSARAMVSRAIFPRLYEGSQGK